MRFKEGVVIFDLHPRVRDAMYVADEVCRKTMNLEAVITSVSEGTHSENSRHYARRRLPDEQDGLQGSLAFDLRTIAYFKTFGLLQKKQIQTYRDELAKALGEDFDVVLESNHIHVELDP